MIQITRDKSANLKQLRSLEKAGLIKVNEVKIEELPKQIRSEVLPVGVWDRTNWDESVWGGNDNIFEKICQIIGRDNIYDVITLEAHIRNGFDIFCTNDRAQFINDGRRENLQKTFKKLKIMTTEELAEELRKK